MKRLWLLPLLLMILIGSSFAQDEDSEINQLRKEIAEKDKQLEEKDKQLEEKDYIIGEERRKNTILEAENKKLKGDKKTSDTVDTIADGAEVWTYRLNCD